MIPKLGHAAGTGMVGTGFFVRLFYPNVEHFKRQYLGSIPIACEARDTVPYPEPVRLGILIHISSIFQKVRLEVQFNNIFLILFFNPINNLSVKQGRVFLG